MAGTAVMFKKETKNGLAGRCFVAGQQRPSQAFALQLSGAFLHCLAGIESPSYRPLMETLYQIVYTSTATKTFSESDLVQLLKGSVQRNSRAGITGLLLYQGGTFIQALEGEKAALTGLFEKISHDPRHHHIIRLIQGPIKQRNFPDSAMAFRDLHSPELRKLPGYSEFLNTPLNGDLLAKDIPACKRLLLVFKKNIR